VGNGVPGSARKRFGTEIAVTDRKASYKTGPVQRDTTEINMAKIHGVDDEPIDFGPRLRLWHAHHSGDGGDDRGAAEHRVPPSFDPDSARAFVGAGLSRLSVD
jgi:hypothetical protein